MCGVGDPQYLLMQASQTLSTPSDRKRPVVRVLSPRLAVRGGEPLPHVFPGDELCLYYPGKWSPDMAIADAIIP